MNLQIVFLDKKLKSLIDSSQFLFNIQNFNYLNYHFY